MNAITARVLLLSVSAGGTLSSFALVFTRGWLAALECYGAVVLALMALLIHAMRDRAEKRVPAQLPVTADAQPAA